MTDSATGALTFGSPVADRISAWAKDNPDATEYCLNDEMEARALLIEILAYTKEMVKDISPHTPDNNEREVRQVAKKFMQDMRKALAQGAAIDYIRELNKTEPLEFIGLRITTPDLVLN